MVKPLPINPDDLDRIPGAHAFYHLIAEHPDAFPPDRLVDVTDYLDRSFTKTPLVVMADLAGLHTQDSDTPWQIVDQMSQVPPHQLFSAFHRVYSDQRHRKDVATNISRGGEGRG